MARRQTVIIENREVSLSNLDKVLYPAAGTTKADVIDYYARIAPAMLPHLKDRPVSLKRFPDGVDGESFFEKNCPSHRPRWVRTRAVPRGSGGQIDYCVLFDRPSLVWVANLAALELHTFLHRVGKLDRPTMVVFDLDPGAPASLRHCAKIALLLRELFDELGLECFVKSSGGKGLHMAIPLNTSITYDRTKAFARAVAEHMAAAHPRTVTSVMSKARRGGKVFIDWSQNHPTKTTACAYTLRAREAPSVSMPLSWDEVQGLSRRRKNDRIDTSPASVLARVDRDGDLFAPVLHRKQDLPEWGA